MSGEAVAEQVLELVRARAGAGVQAEVNVDRTVAELTRFANSFIHQNVAEESITIRLRLHLDAGAGGRTAAGSTTVTSPEGLGVLVERTVEAVRHAPADPGWPGLAAAAPLAGAGGFDEATAHASPAERAARVREFVTRVAEPAGRAAAGSTAAGSTAAGSTATGSTAAGYCRTRHWSGSFANSAGQLVTAQTTEAAFDGMARGEYGDGVARQAAVSLAALDGTVLGARAAAKARATADPVQLPPGRYEVVLEPNAVADLLTHLAGSGFNGKAHAEGRSFVMLGEAQLDPSITIVDDPFAAGTPSFAYDGEGTPKQRLVLVAAGVSTAVVHDRRSAALAGGGAVSTGHALPGTGESVPMPINLGLLPARDEGDGDGWFGYAAPAVDPVAAPLVAGVERGLLVTDLHYTLMLDPKTLVVTGLTRNGVWLIENGELTAPVQNVRFTQSYPEALAPGAVKGIGPVATLLPDSWDIAWWRAPALHLASWHITGNASG